MLVRYWGGQCIDVPSGVAITGSSLPTVVVDPKDVLDVGDAGPQQVPPDCCYSNTTAT